MKVKDVMTTNVATVRTNESLSTAARLMWDCDCGSIPVKNEAGDQVVGMITDRDICMATWSKDRAPSALRVAEAMSGELYCAMPEDSVSTAEGMMRARQIRRLPVLDHAHELVGILSLADIVAQSQRIGAHAAESEVAPTAVASTLAGIITRRATRQTAAP